MKLPVLARIPREVKIVLVTIIGIVIPSIALTFFAFHAVGSERSSAVRREKENLKATVHRAVLSVRNTLNEAFDRAGSMAERYTATADGLKSLGSAAGRLAEDEKLFLHAFVIQGGGKVIHPAWNPVKITRHETVFEMDLFRDAHRWEYEKPDYDRAIKQYREAIQIYRDNKAAELAGRTGIARCLYKLGSYEEAAKAYRALVVDFYPPATADPTGDSLGLRYHLAVCLRHLKREDEYYSALLNAYEFLIENLPTLAAGSAKTYLDMIRPALAVLDRPLAKNKHPDHYDRYQDLNRRRLDRLRERDFAGELAGEFRSDLASKLAASTTGPNFIEKTINDTRRLLVFFQVGRARGRLLAGVGFEIDLKHLRSNILPAALEGLGGPEEAFLTVTEDDKVVHGEKPPHGAVKLASETLPAPLGRFNVELSLPREAALGRFTSIRATIYSWVVALSILAILAGVVFTLLTVSREIKTAQLQGDFVSNVTHELKTPLTSIQMFVETLQDGRISSKAEHDECLDIIASESRRLSRLIERVLDFSRLEGGSKEFRFRSASVPDIVKKSIGIFRQQLVEERVQLHLRIPRNLPPAFMDPDAISEVILNLLTNAVKYTRTEPKEIWVTLRESRANIIVDVADKGIGISRWEARKIFEKFYRSDNRLAREVEGSGLGLAITRRIAKAHGGSIILASKKGHGSRFSLVLKKYVDAVMKDLVGDRVPGATGRAGQIGPDKKAR